MKWFRHETDSRQDFKLKRLTRRFGMEGYGIYWAIVELLAFEQTDDLAGTDVQISLEKYPTEDIAHDLFVAPGRIEEVLGFMAEVGLIDKEFYDQGVLCCKALMKRADDYAKRQNRKKNRKSEHCPNNVPLQEKTREDIQKTREDIQKTREEMEGLWNKTSLPQILTWNRERIGKLSTRMANTHFQEHWKEAVDRLSKSSFALGKNDRGWKASIDWFLANDNNYLKAMEGKYDDKERDRFDKYR